MDKSSNFFSIEDTQQKLKELKELQKNLVKVNVGGEIFYFNKFSMVKYKHKSIFQDFNVGEVTFYDGNQDLFRKYIKNLMINDYGNEVIVLKLKYDDDELVLKSMINEIFYNSTEILNKIKFEREVQVVPVIEINPIENPNVNNYDGDPAYSNSSDSGSPAYSHHSYNSQYS